MAENSLVPDNQPLLCQNCEGELHPEYEFCPHCGQKTTDDLTLGVLFYNTISNYFSFDARFLKSFFPLMFKPGNLAIKFLQGKRLLYLHPAQMYLFVSVIFFFVMSFSTRELVQEADKFNERVIKSDIQKETEKTITQAIDSLKIEEALEPVSTDKMIMEATAEELAVADSIIKAETNRARKETVTYDFDKKQVDSLIAAGADEQTIYKAMGMDDDAGYFEKRLYARVLKLMEGSGAGSIVQAFFDSIPISMFFLLPLFALILKIFYFNKGKYVHHLVFSFYFFSFLFTVLSILFAVNRFIFDIPNVIDWLIVLSTYLYFFIALVRFYRQNWFLTWIKSGVITFIFILFVLPTAFGLLAAFSFISS